MAINASSFEKLILNDERLRAFNNTVPAGILILSAEDGRVLFSNRFFNDVLGTDGISILGDNWPALFVDEADRERLMVSFCTLGEVRNFELRLRRSDGLSRAKRDSTELAILFIDLDGFKSINDTKGHDSGDAVLKEIADRFLHCIRDTDTICRIGGDEFVVLAERASEDLARKIARRVIEQTETSIAIPQGEAKVGASIGIALYPRHGASPDALMKAADNAMYQVKHSGKGAVAVAEG